MTRSGSRALDIAMEALARMVFWHGTRVQRYEYAVKAADRIDHELAREGYKAKSPESDAEIREAQEAMMRVLREKP